MKSRGHKSVNCSIPRIKACWNRLTDGCLSRSRRFEVHTCISQTLPALPTTLLMLIPIEPIPVAMAAAVLVAVLLAVLVAVDEIDMAVGLVDVANVVAVESIVIDIPDIVPMSISDISMFSLLLVIKISGRLSSGHESNGSQADIQQDGRDQC